MKIELTFDEYFKIKALFKSCSFDGYRKNIAGVFYDHKKKKLVATDGHIMRIENPPFRKKKSFLMKERDFCLTQGQFRKILAYEFQGVKKSRWYNNKFKININPEPDEYPDWEKVLMIGAETDCEYWFNAKLLKRFSDSIYNSGTVSKLMQTIRLIPTGKLSIVRVHRENTDGVQSLIGGIMPTRTFNE